jgi:magnesium transporter
MPRFIKFRNEAIGQAPGSLILVGNQKQKEVKIRVMSYGQNNLEEAECKSLDEAYDFLDSAKMTWINIDGLHDPDIFRDIGTKFNISSLVLEDIMNTDHRPKYEEYDNHIYITAKLLSYQERVIESDQFSLLIGNHFVLTFQEISGKHFESVRERIRNTKGRVWSLKSDYLAYALLDCLVDQYGEILGKIGTEIEFIEEEVLKSPKKTTAEEIYRHRVEMNYLRKSIRPIKEITTQLQKNTSPLIHEETMTYFNDLNDHVMTLLDAIESYQSMVMDQHNMYNAGISNRANDIMKTLTVFASIFIPLTFVAGIYGMNFEVMPELSWPLGYLFFWGLVLLLVIVLIIFFRRRKWL